MKQYPDFDVHDNIVHGIRMISENFTSELVVDIDHILEWPECREGGKFKVCVACLKFHDVTDLTVRIEWGDSGYTVAVSDMMINEVVFDKTESTLRFESYYSVTVRMSDGNSFFHFGSSGVSLEILSDSMFTSNQYLTSAERAALLKP